MRAFFMRKSKDFIILKGGRTRSISRESEEEKQ
jgi:hypothetical protein